MLEDYVEVRPENEQRLRALVSAGRIEIGPSYVLPDELLVGAEPLVRNLLIGRAVCRRFGAEPSAVGYLPDSFGHPTQLPQILAGFGTRSFVFSRGMGDELDELGAVFRWRAPDGSEVLAFQQLDHYGNFAVVSDADDGEARIHGILERFGGLLERVGVDDFLLCNGTDHVPVNPGLPGLCSALEDRFPGTRFVISTYADYVAAVGDVEVRSWSGELLGSRIQNILRGVNSARIYVKQENEAAERRLLAAETLGALRTLHDGRGYPISDFNLAWRQLLRCQPHDTICGCSCDEVHRDATARYGSLDRSLAILEDRALAGLAADEGSSGGEVGVVNVLPYRRRGLIEVPGATPAIAELEGFSARTVQVTPAGADSEGGRGRAIENDLLRVEAALDGTLTVLDKQTGVRWDGLHRLEDEHDMGDLYNFCPTVDGEVWRSDRAEVRVRAAGPVVSELELQLEAQRPEGLEEDGRPRAELARLAVCTVVRLVEGSRRVEFRTSIDNALEDHRLRVSFPAGTASGPVRAETAFGVVRRPAARRSRGSRGSSRPTPPSTPSGRWPLARWPC